MRHVRASHCSSAQNSQHVYRHITLSYFKQPVRAWKTKSSKEDEIDHSV